MSLNKRLIRTNDTGGSGGEPQSFTYLDSAVISAGNKPRYWNIAGNGLHALWKNDNNQTLQKATFSTAWDITTAINSGTISSGLYRRALGWNYDGSQQLGMVNVGAGIVGENVSPNYAITNTGSVIANGISQGYSYIFSPSANGNYFYTGALQQARQFITTTGKLTSSDSFSDTTYPVNGTPAVSADGKYLYIKELSPSGIVHIYSLSITYDLTSTKTFIKTLTLPSVSTTCDYFIVSSDGNYAYSYEFNQTNGSVFRWQINY